VSTATIADTAPQRDVLEEPSREPGLEAGHIGVSVLDGMVTLGGHVSSCCERYVAEKTAKRVYVGKAIVNDLEEFKSKIEEPLRRSAERDPRRITVELGGGKVTLRGTVRSSAEKKRPPESPASKTSSPTRPE
jgi:osmotically-inducible protein OsmY